MRLLFGLLMALLVTFVLEVMDTIMADDMMMAGNTGQFGDAGIGLFFYAGGPSMCLAFHVGWHSKSIAILHEVVFWFWE